MNTRMSSTLQRLARYVLLGGAALACADTAWAVEARLTAEFRPSLLDPLRNQFVNTTPQSGYCARWPHLCAKGDFSVSTGLTIQNRRLVQASAEHRTYHFAAVDASWKDVAVTGPGGVQAIVRFRLKLMSQSYREGQGTDNSTPGSYGSAVGGCGGRIGIGNSHFYAYAWALPEGNTYCYRRPGGGRDSTIGVDDISVGYDLVAPDPLALPNGNYRGSVRYSVGKGAQFDIGEGEYSDDELVFNLDLSVEHEFKIDVPPGNDRVLLQPVDGWSPWVDAGRPPSRLQQELPFLLSSSGEFGVYVECAIPQGRGCGIRSARSGVEVPIDVDITMPGMHRVADGEAAVEVRLAMGAPGIRFASGAYLHSRPSRLRFSASGEALSRMLQEPDSRWSGVVTIVFDATP